MNSNDFNDEIEELDTTEEISDTETPEEYLDENNEEYYDNSYSRPRFGEREYKKAKDEKGKYDKDYYKKRGQELDEKVNNAKEEKERDWKTEKKDDDQNKEKDNKENLNHKPEEERKNKNKYDKLKDNYNLGRAKYDRMQNKLNGIKARTYQAMHPVEAAKEQAKDKVKDEGKKAGKAVAKGAAKGAAKAAKATGKLVATGAKAAISFLASNPIVLAVLAGVLLLFIIIFMLFSKPSEEDIDTLGYFDTSCDFNLATVSYSCNPYDGIPKEMSLKEYVIGVAYGESIDQNFSEAAIKALMIIIKTNALAEGNYDSSGDKVLLLNNCFYYYEDAYEELDDEVENEAKKSKIKILEQYYNEIDNFLFISKSYQSEITNLGANDVLKYDDDIVDILATTDKNSYEEILQEIYVTSSEEDDTITVQDNKPYIFIGDSRTVGMRNSASELTDDNTVAKESIGYDWFVSEAITMANDKLEKSSNSYNIISWLGVNDAATKSRVNDYFNKYKELAQGSWSNHTIYVVSVGPVSPDYRVDINGKVYADLSKDVEDFNTTMQKLINDANISNLKYLDLGLAYSDVTSTDGLHYNGDDYNKIFNKIIDKLYQSKQISKSKALFNNIEYCTYYHYSNGGCDIGWWWPIGQSGNYSKGAILRGDPEIVSIGSGPDWGNRFHPVEKVWKHHDGEDLEASLGRNVIATRSGTIVTAVDGNIDHIGAGTGGCGNTIVIDHGDGFFTRYCHLKQGSVSKYSSVGMKVSQGQIIALSGNSGTTTGPHLHFEIREGSANGTTYNPLDYISVDNPRPTGNCSNIGNYTSDASGVCKALKEQNLSDNAIAGLLVNIGAEGAFKTNNLEDCYETGKCCPYIRQGYGYCGTGYLIGNFGNDEAYTNGVSNGTYTNFAIDKAGYGLIQWTTEGRKQGLLDYYQMMKASNPNLSIADVGVQVGYLIQELNSGSYSTAHNSVYNSNNSAYDVAFNVCMDFERPADTYNTCTARAVSSQRTNYEKLVANNCVEGE